jgi:hypothetical protein
MMNFIKIKTAVAKQFDMMSKYELYRTNTTKEQLWDTYLSSFPEGTNPVYKVRTEHDCNCCKQFIRAVGNVVAIIDGNVVSIWDGICDDKDYQVVSDAMAKLVKSNNINNKFFHYEKTAGTSKNFSLLNEVSVEHNHFFVNIPAKFVKPNSDIATLMSEVRSTYDVFLRGLTEITSDSIDTVLELISQNSLYRGEEHKFAIDSFKKVHKEFYKLDSQANHTAFVWSAIDTVPVSVSKIRSTVVGTLLTDLSEGYDLDDAVKSFESKVAPTNYKRPTALITKRMIDDAQSKIIELGLETALSRRFAVMTDITANNILFANRETSKVIGGNIFDELSSQVADKVKSTDKIEEIGIEDFINKVLPTTTSLEVMIDNGQTGNLVSLIAPTDPTARNLFNWDNNFSWSYNGEVADSIKERVKQAGGNVTGDLCCRLAWFNHDDLDFHMKEVGNYEIFFGNRHTTSPCGGRLDVDMNAGMGTTRTPVENIFYQDKNRMKDGIYTLNVYQFSKRETKDVGFEVQVDFMGTVTTFVYDKAVKAGETITVAKIKYSKVNGIEFLESLPSSTRQKDAWGVKTQTFQKVNMMMLSPNQWDDKPVGNKHYFFMIDGCINPDKARGFYNEFLSSTLTPHRKVFEVVGSKMKTEESTNQLSGLGFSSTQRASVLVKVKGSFTRTLKINF